LTFGSLASGIFLGSNSIAEMFFWEWLLFWDWENQYTYPNHDMMPSLCVLAKVLQSENLTFSWKSSWKMKIEMTMDLSHCLHIQASCLSDLIKINKVLFTNRKQEMSHCFVGCPTHKVQGWSTDTRLPPMVRNIWTYEYCTCPHGTRYRNVSPLSPLLVSSCLSFLKKRIEIHTS
jgi:hypothetical protein